eukprot:scaffold1431_cov125-Isochrysis_galbana.AAC.2
MRDTQCIPEMIGRAPGETVKGGGGKGGNASLPGDSRVFLVHAYPCTRGCARGDKAELLGRDFTKDIADPSGGKEPQCSVPPVA